jgi:hypothetical protein
MLAACSDSDQATGSRGAGTNVQFAWQSARTRSGHKLHVAQHRVRCAACHELGGDSVGRAPPARCKACHEQESRIHHAERQAVQRFGEGAFSDCTTCHAFAVEMPATGASPQGGRRQSAAALADLEPSREDCARCHASQQGQTPAVVVHGTSQCLSCHRPHQGSTPEPGRCAECHGEITTSHASSDRPALRVCTTCHQHQHAPASDALATCQPCHAKQQPLVPASALFADGHTACVGCHRPHQFEKNSAAPCGSCHSEVRALAAERVAAHAQCSSCHAPHDVRANPVQACEKCHAEVHPNHPTPNPGRGCVTCHDAHPSASHTREKARACSSCHQQAHTESEFHGELRCTQCHKPHGFALAKGDSTLCKDCHAGEVARATASTGHRDCEGCHRGVPHRPTALLASCGSCHAAEAQKVRPGHQKCTSCHEPHGGTQGTPCKSCHQQEAHSVKVGHNDCTSCHQPHSGAASFAACATCHVEEAASKHGKIAGGCAGCHRPHGPSGPPSPPPCGQCHQTTRLAGLHRLGKHQDCARCHTGHDERPRLTRDTCTACHTDRKGHFADAPSCTSCHLFAAKNAP